ncbi:hypothetical protein ACIBL3_14405 [Kribbella sp. NPDC050124]|uniref:hypothetical protein n=1 Tax=Kribbella sp. NPDC050124 TaxID=3364114 RepID=UPI0037943DCE
MAVLSTVALLTAGSLTLGGQFVPEPAAGNPVQLTNGFYVDPSSNPAVYVKQHPNETAIRDKIASKAGGRWFGNWSGDIKAAVTSYTTAADLLLWLKVPGDSDGNCGIGQGIPAGTFSPTLANHLITGT